MIPEVFKTISKMMRPAVQIDSPRSPKIAVAVGLRRSSGVYSNLVSLSRHWCSQGSSKPSAKVCSQGSKVIPGVAKTISIKELPGIQIDAPRCKGCSGGCIDEGCPGGCKGEGKGQCKGMRRMFRRIQRRRMLRKDAHESQYGMSGVQGNSLNSNCLCSLSWQWIL